MSRKTCITWRGTRSVTRHDAARVRLVPLVIEIVCVNSFFFWTLATGWGRGADTTALHRLEVRPPRRTHSCAIEQLVFLCVNAVPMRERAHPLGPKLRSSSKEEINPPRPSPRERIKKHKFHSSRKNGHKKERNIVFKLVTFESCIHDEPCFEDGRRRTRVATVRRCATTAPNPTRMTSAW